MDRHESTEPSRTAPPAIAGLPGGHRRPAVVGA